MKRDINLLPDKKGGHRKSGGAALAIIAVMVYVIVFGIGIMVPKMLKDAASAMNSMLEQEITQLQPQVDEYEKLKTKLDLLKTSIDSTTSLDFSKYDAARALEIIQSTCPTGVMLERINSNSTTITLDCIAANNYQIAQFALELERSGYFVSVFISGSAPADIVINTNNDIETGNTVRTTLVLTFDLSEKEETEGDTDGEGGEG